MKSSLSTLVLVLLGTSFSVTAATITVSPSPVVVTAGLTYTVDIVVGSAADLYSYGFDLGFNPALLAAQTVTEGPFLPGGGATLFFPGTIDNLAGTISFNAGTLTGAVPGVSGAGILASFSFLALANGAATFDLSQITLLDSTGADIQFAPEPGTGLMGLMMMALLAGRGVVRRLARRWPVLCLLTFTLRAADVPTAQFDNARTMSNPGEIYLTRANVNSAKFGRLVTRPVDGAIFAQPVYAENVAINGRAVNVVYVATMHDVVYAFDADEPTATTPLWTRSLGVYATASGWNTGIGVAGTPVIHRANQALYVVGATLEGGQRVYRLHALDLATGASKFGGAVVIGGQVPGTASEGSGGQVPFLANQQIQRPGLAIAGNSVYVAFSADRDHLPYHGWVFGYHLTNLTQTAIFNTSPNVNYISPRFGGGYAAGIWQSGRAPAVDDAGALYLETGNGDYDGVTEFGNSVLKLASNGAGALSRADWFTPSDWIQLNKWDLDLGSTGPLLLPGTNSVLAGSKTGLFYLFNRNNLGQLQTTPAPAGFQSFLGTSGCASPLAFQACAQIMGQAFAYRSSPPTLYVWAVRDRLRAYVFNNGQFNLTPASEGSLIAPYPGGVLAHSGYRDVASTGIVWALTSNVPDEDFYFGPGFIGAGTLRAFDSANLQNELYNSGQNASRDALGNLASFTTPLVANGKVFVPTLSNQLVVYGLLAGPVSGDVNGDSQVTCGDVAIVRASFGRTSSQAAFDARADVVRDGAINVRDLNLVARSLPAGTTCQ